MLTQALIRQTIKKNKKNKPLVIAGQFTRCAAWVQAVAKALLETMLEASRSETVTKFEVVT